MVFVECIHYQQEYYSVHKFSYNGFVQDLTIILFCCSCVGETYFLVLLEGGFLYRGIGVIQGRFFSLTVLQLPLLLLPKSLPNYNCIQCFLKLLFSIPFPHSQPKFLLLFPLLSLSCSIWVLFSPQCEVLWPRNFSSSVPRIPRSQTAARTSRSPLALTYVLEPAYIPPSFGWHPQILPPSFYSQSPLLLGVSTCQRFRGFLNFNLLNSL